MNISMEENEKIFCAATLNYKPPYSLMESETECDCPSYASYWLVYHWFLLALSI